jgi:hypothetical protein
VLDGTRYFVEVDRGTRPLRSWIEKVQAYEAYRGSPQLAARYGAERFGVLVTASSPTRLIRIAEDRPRDRPGPPGLPAATRRAGPSNHHSARLAADCRRQLDRASDRRPRRRAANGHAGRAAAVGKFGVTRIGRCPGRLHSHRRASQPDKDALARKIESVKWCGSSASPVLWHIEDAFAIL